MASFLSYAIKSQDQVIFDLVISLNFMIDNNKYHNKDRIADVIIICDCDISCVNGSMKDYFK